jgi:uncharacterized repeat protein (TIGR01451 family)
VADLAITKSHTGDFVVGANGTYTLRVSNNGPNSATGTITVTDTLPAGLSYVSGTGTGWSCNAAGQTVTCTRSGPLASGAAAPDITLTVSVGAAAYPGVTNTVSVSSADFDNVSGNSTNVADPTTVLAPDLSTSTKTWVDINGGDQNPGDVIRYTITLNETGGGGASGVTTTDTLPATLTLPAVVTCPAGATCGFAGQTLTAANISVPAGGTTAIQFDATIAGGTPAGTLIDNTATITNPAGPGAAPAAATIVVSGSTIPQTGNKPLYLYGAPGLQLSRTQTPGTPAYVNLLELQSVNWTQSPALQSNVTIDPSVNPNVPVNLYLASNNAGGQNRNITVSLACSSGGTTLSANRVIFLSTAVTLQTFNLPLAAPLACNAGNSWVLTIRNNTTGGGSRELRVYPVSGGNISQAILPSLNVINVDSVALYDAAYPGGSTLATAPAGTTVYVRSTVSDPFGSFDIASANIIITDPTGTVRVNGAAMTQVFDSGAATRIYQYAYAIPSAGPAGAWTFRVTSLEGTEGTTSDYSLAGLPVTIPAPNILTLKAVSVVSDPVNTAPPYRSIPGAVMQYIVTVSNQGNGSTDAGSVVLTDPVPLNTGLFVGDIGAPGSGPVAFIDGAPSSGLTYTFLGLGSGADSIEFSNTAFPYVYGYTPLPDGNGFDSAVTSLRITLGGAFAYSAGAPYPSFTLQFRVRVK